MNLAERLLREFLEQWKEQGHKPSLRITFAALDAMPNVHQCTSHREGDLIIFRCPICEKYERRFNLRTGQMSCVGHQEGVIHTGTSSDAVNMEALTLNTHPN